MLGNICFDNLTSCLHSAVAVADNGGEGVQQPSLQFHCAVVLASNIGNAILNDPNIAPTLITPI